MMSSLGYRVSRSLGFPGQAPSSELDQRPSLCPLAGPLIGPFSSTRFTCGAAAGYFRSLTTSKSIAAIVAGLLGTREARSSHGVGTSRGQAVGLPQSHPESL